MKMKLALFALAAALTFGAAAPSFAAPHDYRNYDRGYRSDYRPAEITVRAFGRTITVDRGDRFYYALQEGPYHFKPGRTYTYEGNCNYRCDVQVFDPYGRERRFDRIQAPLPPGLGGRRY